MEVRARFGGSSSGSKSKTDDGGRGPALCFLLLEDAVRVVRVDISLIVGDGDRGGVAAVDTTERRCGVFVTPTIRGARGARITVGGGVGADAGPARLAVASRWEVLCQAERAVPDGVLGVRRSERVEPAIAPRVALVIGTTSDASDSRFAERDATATGATRVGVARVLPPYTSRARVGLNGEGIVFSGNVRSTVTSRRLCVMPMAAVTAWDDGNTRAGRPRCKQGPQHLPQPTTVVAVSEFDLIHATVVSRSFEVT